MKDLGYFGLCLGIGALVGLVYERGKIVGKSELAEKATEGLKEFAEAIGADVVEEATNK